MGTHPELPLPEGDTILRLARRLDEAMAGSTLRAALSPRAPAVRRLAGGRVEGVAAVGKHTVFTVRLAGGGELALRVHLGMDGRWRLRPRTERRAALPDRLSVALSTPALTAVAWDCMEVEVARPRALWAPKGALGRLGPDVLAEDFLPEAVVPRARARTHACLADLLLDQTVACGVGNIYKNEALFVCGRHPETRPEDLDDAELAALFAAARALMLPNLEGRRRVTARDPGLPRLPSTRTFVHGRGGHACLRCGGPVVVALLGRHRRQTFWCPACQPRLPGASPSAARAEEAATPPLLDEVEPAE